MYKFRTLDSPDTDAPVITRGPIVFSTDRAASYKWSTDEPADSYVFYRVAGNTGQRFIKVGSPEFELQHSVTIKGLERGVDYEFFLASSDFAGNAVVFPDVFKESLYKSTLEQKINQPPGGSGRFRTSRTVDNSAPQIIDGPNILNKTASTITLGWKTDEAGDSFVEYETLSKAAVTSRLSLLKGDGQNVVDHAVTLTNLDSATTYRFAVQSTDINRNGPTRSRESSVTTLQGPGYHPAGDYQRSDHQRRHRRAGDHSLGNRRALRQLRGVWLRHDLRESGHAGIRRRGFSVCAE